MNITPLHDRVLLRLIPNDFVGEKKSEGGIIIPTQVHENADRNPIRRAEVLAVGEGEVLFDGTRRPLSVSVGDEVLVHENEVLFLQPMVDPSLPEDGLIGERSILAKVG